MRKHSLRRHLANVEMVGREVQMVEGYGGYGGESRVFEMPDSEGMLGRLIPLIQTFPRKFFLEIA